jgi:predicted phage terminase large subunit-like protein
VKRVYYEQRPSVISIERLGYGLSIIQELVREGFPITRLEPDQDKVARALPAAARYEEHRVFHPRGAFWLDDFEQELLVFPNGRNDDQVDVTAYAAMQLPARLARNRGTKGSNQRESGRMLVGNAMGMNF